MEDTGHSEELLCVSHQRVQKIMEIFTAPKESMCTPRLNLEYKGLCPFLSVWKDWFYNILWTQNCKASYDEFSKVCILHCSTVSYFIDIIFSSVWTV